MSVLYLHDVLSQPACALSQARKRSLRRQRLVAFRQTELDLFFEKSRLLSYQNLSEKDEQVMEGPRLACVNVGTMAKEEEGMKLDDLSISNFGPPSQLQDLVIINSEVRETQYVSLNATQDVGGTRKLVRFAEPEDLNAQEFLEGVGSSAYTEHVVFQGDITALLNAAGKVRMKKYCFRREKHEGHVVDDFEDMFVERVVSSLFVEGVGRSWMSVFGSVPKPPDLDSPTQATLLDSWEPHRRRYFQNEQCIEPLRMFYRLDEARRHSLGEWMTDANNLTNAEHARCVINLLLVHNHRHKEAREALEAASDPDRRRMTMDEADAMNSFLVHSLSIRPIDSM